VSEKRTALAECGLNRAGEGAELPVDKAKLSDTGRRRLLVAAAIFIVVAVCVAVTARDAGLTWDEAIYFGSASNYLAWFKNLSAESFGEGAIFKTWWQADHPPLAKVWIALSWALFGNMLDPVAAARVGAGIVFALAAVVIYLWLSDRQSERAGFIAAGVFVLMPRIFAHGHFANIEMLTLLLWLLTIVAFEKGIGDVRWSAACGLLFGLALLTKINGAFLPVVLAPWGLLFHRRKAVPNLIFMAILGPLIFFAGWPVMWHHPTLAARGYLANKLDRSAVETYYLGTMYGSGHPPWHYPFVMLLATTPLPVLAAAGCGIREAIARLRDKGRTAGHAALLLWGLAFPVLLLALPGVPKYDGIRLMLPAYPFLAALAATGACAAWDRIRSRLKKPQATGRVIGIIGALWLLAPVVMFHPFQLCYYGELAGGPWGANKLGFETTYWHETFDGEVVRYLNDHASSGSRVALVGMEYRVWRLYQKSMGEIRADLRHADFATGEWDYLVVIMRQGKLTKEVREFMAKHQPVWERTLPPFGAPSVCAVYSSG